MSGAVSAWRPDGKRRDIPPPAANHPNHVQNAKLSDCLSEGPVLGYQAGWAPIENRTVGLGLISGPTVFKEDSAPTPWFRAWAAADPPHFTTVSAVATFSIRVSRFAGTMGGFPFFQRLSRRDVISPTRQAIERW